jgi:hypothetical protein
MCCKKKQVFPKEKKFQHFLKKKKKSNFAETASSPDDIRFAPVLSGLIAFSIQLLDQTGAPSVQPVRFLKHCFKTSKFF